MIGDPCLGIGQAGYNRVWRHRLLLIVTTVDENRPTPCALASLDVTPAVPDHVAACQVQVEIGRCLHEKARSGLAACTAVRIVMGAQVERIEGDLAPQAGIDGIHGPGVGVATSDIRLIRDDDQQESGSAKAGAGFGHARKHVGDLAPRRVGVGGLRGRPFRSKRHRDRGKRKDVRSWKTWPRKHTFSAVRRR